MRKKAKYQELVEICRGNEWTAHCEPTELGCRVFPGSFYAAHLVPEGCMKAKNIKASERASR